MEYVWHIHGIALNSHGICMDYGWQCTGSRWKRYIYWVHPWKQVDHGSIIADRYRYASTVPVL